MRAVHPPRRLASPTPLPSEGGIRSLHIYLLFFMWTLFSVLLYARFTTLGDSNSYLTGAYDEAGQLRTVIIQDIAGLVNAVVHNELLSHLVFSAFAATGVAYMVRNARVHGRYRWPLLAILLTPNFGVWASVIGRESIFVGMLGLFLGSVLAYWRKPAVHRAMLALLCVGGMSFIRAPYGLGLGLFFVMFLAYRSGPRVHLSAGVHALLLIAMGALVLLVAWAPLNDYINIDVLPKALHYFRLSSMATRDWVQIDTTWNLLTSLWWSLPLALVGPTPGEVMARPLTLPFFLSGLVIFSSLLYSIVVAFRTPAGTERKILLLGWLPAVSLILIAYVPFGIYNAGSAIRYASCFLLFLIFPSMLRSAAAAEDAVDVHRPPLPWPRASYVAFNRTLQGTKLEPAGATTGTVE